MNKNYTLFKKFILCSFCLLAGLNWGNSQVTDSEMEFDGVNDYLELTDFPTLDGAYTFECYMRSDFSTEGTIWNFDGENFTPWFGTYPDSSVTIFDYDDYYYSSPIGSMMPDTTYHLAFVWDGTEGRLYVDGIMVDAQPTQLTTPDGSFSIGYTFFGTDTYAFKGFLDEFRVSDVARYAGDMVTIPSLPWATDANTVAYFHFDECMGQSVTSAGGGLTLTVGSSADVDDNDPTWACENMVNINDPSFQNKISIFPNPTSRKLNVDLGQIYSAAQLEVTDVLGKVVLSKTYLEADKMELDLNFPKGVYYLNVFSEGKNATFKIVKQ
jgi:hypothetical protein